MNIIVTSINLIAAKVLIWRYLAYLRTLYLAG
jgi:hypothetical protein